MKIEYLLLFTKCLLHVSALTAPSSGRNIISRKHLLTISGSDSSVGIATDYRLDGTASNPGADEIFRPFRPALGPIQPPVKWVPGLSRE